MMRSQVTQAAIGETSRCFRLGATILVVAGLIHTNFLLMPELI